MYAKLINNTIRPAPNKLAYNGKLYFNPPEKILLDAGYKPVRDTTMPTDAPSGKHYEYGPPTETETEIIRTLVLVDDPVYTEPEPTIADLENAIKEAINSDN